MEPSDGASTGADRPRRRVLVVSADMGGGHNATAAALEEEIARRWPGSAIRRIDVLDLMGRGVGRAFRSIYVTNVEHTPWLYEFFYATLWRHRWFADASKRFTGTWAGRRLVGVIDGFDPDVIVSTYPLGSSGLAWLRRHRGLAVPAGAWVSDFAPHPFWVYRDLDLNVVAHPVSAETAAAAEPGAPVVVGPLPVVSAFGPAGRTPAADSGVGPLRVLVSCGSYSFGDVVDTIERVVAADPAIRVVAVTGRSQELRSRLEGLALPPYRLEVLGWVDDMPALLASSDLLLTNAGGATALEALATRTPILMYRPIAAHGVANADLMVVAGLADVASDGRRLTEYLRSTVHDRSRLAELAARADPGSGGEGPVDALGLLAAVRPSVSRRWPMRPNDAFFAHLDDGIVRQELGVVCELGPGPDGAALTCRRLRASLTGWAGDFPALRREPTRQGRPGWWLHRRIDVDQHLVELAPSVRTGTQDPHRRLMSAIERFWARPLPAGRPAWQVGLVRDHSSGTALVAFKLHHSVADGVIALTMLERLLAGRSGSEGSGTNGVASRPSRRPISTAERPVHPLARLRHVTGGLASLAARGTASRQPLTSVRCGPGIDLVTWQASLGELRAVARALHARPHEVSVALIAELLTRTLTPAGLLRAAGELRVMVPVAFPTPGISGNWTGALSMDLPVAGDFAERVEQVRQRLRHQTKRGEPIAAYAIMRLAGRLPVRLHAAATRAAYHARFFHAVVSYLPGPRGELRLAGAPVLSMFPVLPTAPTVRVAAGLLTVGSQACVGLTLDSSLGLSPGALTEILDQIWTEATDRLPSGRPRVAAFGPSR